MRKLQLIVIVCLVVGALVASTSTALADKPDGPVTGPGPNLCPAVGAGVFNADSHNGDNGVEALGPLPSGQYTFYPGNNQAGAHANPNGYNAANPGGSPGPGNGNSDWSPIWPGDTI